MMIAKNAQSDTHRTPSEYDSCLEGYLEASEQLEKRGSKLLDLIKDGGGDTTPLRQNDRQILEDVISKLATLRNALGKRTDVGLSALLGSNRVKAGLNMRSVESNRGTMILKKIMGDSQNATLNSIKMGLLSQDSDNVSHLSLSASFSNVPSMSDSLVLNRKRMICSPPMSQMSQICTPRDNGTGEHQSNENAAACRGTLSLGDLESDRHSAVNKGRGAVQNNDHDGTSNAGNTLKVSKGAKSSSKKKTKTDVGTTEHDALNVSNPVTKSGASAPITKKKLKKGVVSKEVVQKSDQNGESGVYTQLVEPTTSLDASGDVGIPQPHKGTDCIAVTEDTVKVKCTDCPTGVAREAETASLPIITDYENKLMAVVKAEQGQSSSNINFTNETVAKAKVGSGKNKATKKSTAGGTQQPKVIKGETDSTATVTDKESDFEIKSNDAKLVSSPDKKTKVTGKRKKNTATPKDVASTDTIVDSDVKRDDLTVKRDTDKVTEEALNPDMPVTIDTVKRSSEEIQTVESKPKKTKTSVKRQKAEAQPVTEDLESQASTLSNKTPTKYRNMAKETNKTDLTKVKHSTEKRNTRPSSKKEQGCGSSSQSPSKSKSKSKTSTKDRCTLLLSYTGKRRDDIVKRLMKAVIYSEKDGQYFEYLDEPKDEHITHLIAPCDMKRPTLKILYALCQGAYILKPDYLYEAERTERWPDEVQYEHDMWTPRAQRLRPFDLMPGVKFYLIGKGKKLSVHDVGRLAIHCGARVVETIDEATHCVIPEGAKPSELTDEYIPEYMTIVTENWIVNVINDMKLLPPDVPESQIRELKGGVNNMQAYTGGKVVNRVYDKHADSGNWLETASTVESLC